MNCSLDELTGETTKLSPRKLRLIIRQHQALGIPVSSATFDPDPRHAVRGR